MAELDCLMELGAKAVAEAMREAAMMVFMVIFFLW
jgi:hypothetical protein